MELNGLDNLEQESDPFLFTTPSIQHILESIRAIRLRTMFLERLEYQWFQITVVFQVSHRQDDCQMYLVKKDRISQVTLIYLLSLSIKVVYKIGPIDIKKLIGYSDLFRMRINSYRVIYKVINNKIILIDVIDADNRGDIY